MHIRATSIMACPSLLLATSDLPIQLEVKQGRTHGGTSRVREVICGSSPAGLVNVFLMGFGRRDGSPSYVADAEVGWVYNPSPRSQGESFASLQSPHTLTPISL